MKNEFTFTTNVSSLDLSALLVSLGYPLYDVKATHHIDLNAFNNRPRPVSATWHFGTTSPYARNLGTIDKVIKKYSFPGKGENALNVFQYAKIAAHNYQVLKSVVLDGAFLQQLYGPNYVILKNNNGYIVENTVTYGATSDLAAVAIACALGCRCTSWHLSNGVLYVATDTHDGINANVIAQMKDDPAIASESNFDILPVLICTFINREQLQKEIHENQKKIMLTRGDRMAFFEKGASESLKRKVLAFINE